MKAIQHLTLIMSILTVHSAAMAMCIRGTHQSAPFSHINSEQSGGYYYVQSVQVWRQTCLGSKENTAVTYWANDFVENAYFNVLDQNGNVIGASHDSFLKALRVANSMGQLPQSVQTHDGKVEGLKIFAAEVPVVDIAN